jgi:O-antigen ligase
LGVAGKLVSTSTPLPGTVARRQLAGLAAGAALVSLFAMNLNYLIVSWFGSVGSRYASVPVAPEVLPLIAMILLSMPFIVFVPSTRAAASGRFLVLALVGLCLWAALISISVHGNVRAALTLIVPLVVFASSFGLARCIPGLLGRTLARHLPLLPFVTFLLLLGFFVADRMTFDVGWLKPQIVGGIRSSEISIFVGVQFFYCLYAMDHDRAVGCRRLLPLAGLAVSGLMLIWMLSIGSILTVIVLLAIRSFLSLRGRAPGAARATLAGVIALIIVATLIPTMLLQDVIASKAQDYTDEGVRLPTLVLLLQFIVNEPVTGIGLGEFVNRSYIPLLSDGLYPHNNLLGIAAELGLPAGGLYLVFVVATLVAGANAVRRSGSRRNCNTDLVMLALCCFTYLHVKGFVQDTWQLKESYFWAGVIAGLLSPLQADGAVRQ